jgi:hypothetical protein
VRHSGKIRRKTAFRPIPSWASPRNAHGSLIVGSFSAANLQASIKRRASAHPGGTDAQ